MKIEDLGNDYFTCTVEVDGIPAQAAALMQPAEPDVGISHEYIEELLVFDSKGHEAAWLEVKLDDDKVAVDVETQVLEALKEERDDAEMDAAGDRYEEREYDREFFGSY